MAPSKLHSTLCGKNQAEKFVNYYFAVNTNTKNIWFYMFFYTSFFTYYDIQNLKKNWRNDPCREHTGMLTFLGQLENDDISILTVHKTS